MKKTVYQVCTRCVMDTTDPEILFDEKGVCNHCNNFDKNIKMNWFPNKQGEVLLKETVEKIKLDGINKQYDCIIGLSGGVDSSYLAMKAVELGLRPLAVHVDAGWNSELAEKNIKSICKTLNIDLYTIKVDWDEMRDLQVAFLKAGVPNQDIPQDHAFFAGLYSYAVRYNIKYVLHGSNIATESILPKSWGFNAMDAKHLKSIHRKFGSNKLLKYPIVSFFNYYINFPYIKKMQVCRLLNYMEYSKDIAIKELEDKVGWNYYGGKHYESRFTKFFQAYYLPVRFGYDKRKAHLSSLVVSGLLSREDALLELEKDLYPEIEFIEDKEFVLKKLKITDEEFDQLMNMPIKSHLDYPSNIRLHSFVKNIYEKINRKKH